MSGGFLPVYALPVGILLSVPYIFLNNSYLHFIRSFTCFQSWLLYFDTMTVEGRPILEVMEALYAAEGVDGLMEEGFRFCQEHEAEIRRQMK